MANEFVNFTPYDQQMAELQRRQRMAELMAQQASQPLETPQSGGRMIAKVSPVAGLAKMLQAYMGGKQQREISKEQSALENRARGEAMDWMNQFNQGKAQFVGQPMSQDQALEAAMSSSATQPTGQNVQMPFTPQEKSNQINQAMLSGNPNMRLAAQLAASQKSPTISDVYNKIDFDKATPESRKLFEASYLAGKPDYSLLQKISDKAEKPTVAGGMWINPQTNKWEEIPQWAEQQEKVRKAGASNVNTTYGAPVSGVNAQGNPVFFQPSKEGGKPAIIPGVAPEKKQPTAEQAGAAGFAGRLKAADQIISASQYVPTLAKETKGKIPLVGNFLMTPAQQEMEQAKRNFITAQLRKESGASISPSEFSTAEKMYFPQPGDTAEVIKQKAMTRQQAIAAMQGMSGNAFPSIQDAPPPGAVRRVK